MTTDVYEAETGAVIVEEPGEETTDPFDDGSEPPARWSVVDPPGTLVL